MEQETLTFDNLRAVLMAYGKQAQELYKYNLGLKAKNASRKLADSVSFNVKENDQNFTVSLSLEDYWRYIEYGRKPGKFPPPDAILAWIKVKPVLPRPMTSLPPSALGKRNTRLPSPKSLAYLIGRKIAKEGIEPTPIMEVSSKQVFDQFIDDIRYALRKDVGDMLAKITAQARS